MSESPIVKAAVQIVRAARKRARKPSGLSSEPVASRGGEGAPSEETPPRGGWRHARTRPEEVPRGGSDGRTACKPSRDDDMVDRRKVKNTGPTDSGNGRTAERTYYFLTLFIIVSANILLAYYDFKTTFDGVFLTNCGYEINPDVHTLADLLRTKIFHVIFVLALALLTVITYPRWLSGIFFSALLVLFIISLFVVTSNVHVLLNCAIFSV